MSNQIKATCPEHGKFDAGIELSPGSSAEMIGNTSSCPTCGQTVPIPDGIYEGSAFGVVRK